MAWQSAPYEALIDVSPDNNRSNNDQVNVDTAGVRIVRRREFGGNVPGRWNQDEDGEGEVSLPNLTLTDGTTVFADVHTEMEVRVEKPRLCREYGEPLPHLMVDMWIQTINAEYIQMAENWRISSYMRGVVSVSEVKFKFTARESPVETSK
ncbi:uncharacterized protein LOC131933399 [Physella acuta]|uniref:uncharacterized protein LOC131933399 n=1 Tax=Physella acuta TaxID=109671 RepID=UPI0027DD79B9|nr:uncharacterized protein LOC131933399 [Physella acuta]XP_059146156.1 uncharacterized protein LOC131933399 [Physella acuta]XP_059146157.1 uncharacterized protein LOC131933399 [Physella acuta]